ncbi:MAG: hypothetical protein AB7T63_13570 [Planctomycetota bacterium]
MALVLPLGGCGPSDDPPASAPLAEPTETVGEVPAAELRLPIVGTAGRAPEGPSVIHVMVDADGRIEVDGEGPLSLEALRQALYDRTRDRWWREDDGTSRRLVLIDADARVPWVVPWWVMQAGTMPSTRLRRCFLGVWCREAGGGAGLKRGAIACFLPKSPYILYANRQQPSPRLVVQMAMHDGAASDPGEILPALRACIAEAPEVAAWFTLAADEGLGAAAPTSFVAQVLDLALAAGAKELLLQGPGYPSPGGPREVGRPVFDPGDVDALLRYVAELKALDAQPRLMAPGAPDAVARGDTSHPAGRGRLPVLYGGGLLPDESEPLARGGDEEDTSAYQANGGAELMALADVFDPGLRPERDVDGLLPQPVPPGIQRRRGLRGEDTEDAFLLALRWLAAQQLPGGAWASDAAPAGDVRSSGLALLAYTAGGYGPRGDHEYADIVRRGIAWLASRQDGAGFVTDGDAPDPHRGHAAATLALVEAYRLAPSRRLQPVVQAALHAALDQLQRADANPADHDTTLDMALPLVGAWIANERARRNGSAAAFEPASRIEAVVRQMPGRLGVPKDDAQTAARAWLLGLLADPGHADELEVLRTRLADQAALWQVPAAGTDPAVWWFAALALHQGDTQTAVAFRQHMHPRGVQSQIAGRDATARAGSWDPPSGGAPDRVQTTALMALAYAVAYRHEHAFGLR